MHRRGFGFALAAALPVLSGCAGVLDAASTPPGDPDGVKLLPENGDRGDWFGYAVASGGDTVVVGAPYADGPERVERGSVSVFERAGDGWRERATLAPGDAGAATFGFAVAVSGDTAVVGAPQATGRGEDHTGSAHVFERAGGEWRERATLVPDDARPGDEFGTAVAVDGDTVVVGADGDGAPDGDYAGAAYVFERTGDGWRERTRLAADDRAPGDQFGLAVAVDGDTAVVGSRFDSNANGREAGSAYVFERAGDGWTRRATLLADDGDAGDWFGFSVAVEGGTAVVGTRSDEDPNGEDAGSAYAFERAGGEWSQAAKLVPDDGDPGDVFGRAVGLSGDTAVVGAKWDENPNGEDAGSAYVFRRRDGDWSRQAKLDAPGGDAGDTFGFAVAVDDDSAVVGAPHEAEPNGTAAGAAYVFPV